MLSTGYAPGYTVRNSRDAEIMMVINIFAWLAVSICFICVGIVLAEARKARRIGIDKQSALDRIQRFGDLADEIRDLDDRVQSLDKSLKRLHSRAGMREVRERRGQNGAAPNWQTDPHGWLAYAEKKLGIGSQRPVPPPNDEED